MCLQFTTGQKKNSSECIPLATTTPLPFQISTLSIIKLYFSEFCLFTFDASLHKGKDDVFLHKHQDRIAVGTRTSFG